MRKWEGIFSILMTAYTRSGDIDAEAMRSSIDFVIEGGVHGVVALGSVGENPYLSQKEKRRVIDIVVDEVNGRVPVVVGTGEVSTDMTIEMSRYAADAGADALMICLPIYWRIGEENILAHYSAVVRAVDKPVILYNIPSTTHLEMTPELVVKLAELEGVIGIKESIGDLDQIRAVIESTDDEFSVFAGISRLLLDVLKIGGAGCFTPDANIFPQLVVGIYSAFKQGDIKRAEALQNELSDFTSLIGLGGPAFIAAIKELMNIIGIPIESTVKSPLPALTDRQKAMIRMNAERKGLTKRFSRLETGILKKKPS